MKRRTCLPKRCLHLKKMLLSAWRWQVLSHQQDWEDASSHWWSMALSILSSAQALTSITICTMRSPCLYTVVISASMILYSRKRVWSVFTTSSLRTRCYSIPMLLCVNAWKAYPTDLFRLQYCTTTWEHTCSKLVSNQNTLCWRKQQHGMFPSTPRLPVIHLLVWM